MGKVDTFQCTLRLPEDLARKAKRLCFEKRKTFQGWVRELIEAALKAEGYPEVLEKIYSGEKEAPLVSERMKIYKRRPGAKQFYPEGD